MSVVRSERVAALLLLVAAVIGLVVANSPISAQVLAVEHAEFGPAGTPLQLSLGEWVSEGLLAVFFFVAAVELRNEFTNGQLTSVKKALRPAVAAAGGVLVPVILYLAITAGSGYSRGWPVPTATDIAFALGVLAVFGRSIPSRLRIFMLALAILDDVVGIVIIAVFFAHDVDLAWLGAAAVTVTAFGFLSHLLKGRARIPVAAVLVVLAVLSWAFVVLSGVHPTIAGVALGLAMAHTPGLRARHLLEPFTNGVVLPLFAFTAALVPIPQVGIGELSRPFWGILIALPVGKLIGIALATWLYTVISRDNRPSITFHGLMTAGALGGIGFTVSLLMNELAFASHPEIADQGTLAVLLGSGVSIVAASILVSTLNRYYLQLRRLRERAVAAVKTRDAPDVG
ncbi:Na+/H+ antiporter NhaA [Leifsonia sp. fls2-241-R2A-40a]|uniref:Na+/H+ antiporter NhaA n=1 Tax=Leifsonia sp. fls2-241-R2A-40a TaxID=3040290 RepID=UPI00254BF603|nr:Na+/H+ antiporter NhaA [Leifsonia sp. fls2-241-R2A-40a]